MNGRPARAVAVLVMLMLASALVRVPAASAEDLHTGEILRTWQRWDLPVQQGVVSRTWMFGPDLTAPLAEPYAESDDGQRVVQYFDKTRLEINHVGRGSGTLWYVTNGLLATELITGRLQTGDERFEQREPAAIEVAGDPGNATAPTYATFTSLLAEPPREEDEPLTERLARDGAVVDDPELNRYTAFAGDLVPETNHRVATPFAEFLQSGGTLYDVNVGFYDAFLFENPWYVVGYPISEAYWARVTVAGSERDVLVQCFERRCLTWTPENPSGWRVEAGNVGRHYYGWRYGDLPQPQGAVAYVGQPWVHGCCAELGGDIRLASAHGTRDVNLTNSPEGEWDAVWAPDGRRVAFARILGERDLYVMNADGSGIVQLTHGPAVDFGPRWAPDSARLLLTTDVGGERHIALVGADGSGYRDLGPGFEPCWSPDGRWIAFERQVGDAAQVFVMAVSGGDARQVTSVVNGASPTGWTPDGAWLTYVTIDGRHAIRPDGTDERPLWPDLELWMELATWSPDGSQIAFISGGDLWVMDADGSRLVNLTNGRDWPQDRLSWSPDGRFIVYRALDFDAIRVVEVDNPGVPHRTVAHGYAPQWVPQD